MADGTAHLGLYCQLSGHWLRWVKQRADILLQAPPRPDLAASVSDIPDSDAPRAEIWR
jgi:hypothetical protein